MTKTLRDALEQIDQRRNTRLFSDEPWHLSDFGNAYSCGSQQAHEECSDIAREALASYDAAHPSGEDGGAVALADCPIGLFLYDGNLCLKTEYGNNEGRIDAYIVSSGEFFWGNQPQTIASQRKQLVIPVDHDELLVALRSAELPVKRGDAGPQGGVGQGDDR